MAMITTISCAEIYKSKFPKIPTGYEFKDFRMVRAEDCWLGIKGEVGSPGDVIPSGPRVILKKAPLPKKLSFGLEISHDNSHPKIRFSLKCGETSFFIYPENVKEILDYARTEMGWKV